MTGLSTSAGSRHALRDRGDDLYQSPPEAVAALMRAERLPYRIWEPACGPGSIVRVLREAGHEVFATDLVDYGWPGQNHHGWDFLFPSPDAPECDAIVTNPPFKLAGEFVRLSLERAPLVAMLLRLAFIESTKRSPILDSGHLARVHVFRNRLPMMHREGRGVEVEKTNSSALAFAWFVWDRNHSGPTELRRISWEPLP
jgi:hypothetical protein